MIKEAREGHVFRRSLPAVISSKYCREKRKKVLLFPIEQPSILSLLRSLHNRHSRATEGLPVFRILPTLAGVFVRLKLLAFASQVVERATRVCCWFSLWQTSQKKKCGSRFRVELAVVIS